MGARLLYMQKIFFEVGL